MSSAAAVRAPVKWTSRADELTLELLNAVIHTRHPAVSIVGFDLLESRQHGEQMVSTSGRAVLKLHYAAGAPRDLPDRVVCKLAIGAQSVMAAFYENEVQVYTRVRPDLLIEAPRSLGALYDATSAQFVLMLEDLSQRGARFPNVTQEVALPAIESLVDTLATLHASHWESPRFSGDLSWLQSHVHGQVAHVMNELAPPLIQHEIDTQAFKREMVQRLRTTGPELLAAVKCLQRYQSRLPQTLLHGDTHLGNTYLLPHGSAGLLDWQLSVRGYCMHDVSYLLVTSLPIALRREHERTLLNRYRERLMALGVKSAPTAEQVWNEYRRAVVWGVYVGWLTTPVVNYGWEINVVNHLRLTTAYEDLDTARLVKEVMV
jgi:aminoglycoside/choline kinase family phosphotransferase